MLGMRGCPADFPLASRTAPLFVTTDVFLASSSAGKNNCQIDTTQDSSLHYTDNENKEKVTKSNEEKDKKR